MLTHRWQQLIHKAMNNDCIFVDNGLLRLMKEQVKTFENHIPGKLKVAKAGPCF